MLYRAKCSIVLNYLSSKIAGTFSKPLNFSAMTSFFPRHFLLQWTNTDATTKGHEFVYIDAFNRGTRLTQDEVRAQDDHPDNTNTISIATPIEVKKCFFL